MKVYIGPYTNWVGPYQIADLLRYVGVGEDTRFSVGERLSKTPLKNLCEWAESKRRRTIKVHIHEYDTWSMDSTLSLIILPMLVQLAATKHGAPFTDDADAPEHLRSTSAPPKENEWDTDGNHFVRWDWILGEMIWAFQRISDKATDGIEFDETLRAREAKGFLLFGKYYRALWD
jgi:hypothetical protein